MLPLRIEGRWCYLYRAIDKEGNLVDVYLSDVRDQAAVEAFFKHVPKPNKLSNNKKPHKDQRL